VPFGGEASLEGAAVTQFGKYQLFATLGKGGMADVFLSVARGQMGFNKLAVIKRLKPSLADDPAFRNMFLEEARLAARLNHPNIVHTYEVGESNGIYFIAMEYLEGQALNKVVKECVRNQQRVPPEICARMIADALAGLGYAHELRDYDGRPLNVIHRDISPHNLFVTYDGHTKLVDFGIAKSDSSATETEVGILKGKVAYMSPEQALGQRLDARSDLFAMGIVLWELLTHQRLMTGENAANTLHRLMNEPIPHVSDVQPDIDMELDRIVNVALQKDVKQRFQSASEFREALEIWLATHRARQEDVSRTMLALFTDVRTEVQKQIQRHMALVAPAKNTAELQAITGDLSQKGLLRLGMGGSGSGSGVISNYGGVASTPSSPPSNPPSGMTGPFGPPGFPLPPSTPSLASGPSAAVYQTGPVPPVNMMAAGMMTPMMTPQMPQAQPRSNVLLIVITIGCFVIAALIIVMFGIRRGGGKDFLASNGTASAAAPAVSETPAPPASTAEAITIPTVTAVATKPPPPSPAPVNRPTSRPQPAPQPRPAPPPQPAAEPAEPGYVTVNAYPWAKVTEGAKVICPATPCNKVQMSPGAHTLTFENGADPSQKQTVTVQVKAGETTPKNIGFK
jgi:serine/threonine-protein kinase